MISYLMVCGLIYQLISLAVYLRKAKWQNQTIGGLIGDFIEKYFSNSAVIYAAPIVFLNIVTVSQLSKMFILVAYLFLFVMPNVMSLTFLNYYKIVIFSTHVSKIAYELADKILYLKDDGLFDLTQTFANSDELEEFVLEKMEKQ